jgi:hypothetical protein
VIEALLNFFSPFRMMKDVSRGTLEQRMAAFRHNRSMRGHLSACMRRWIISCGVAIALTSICDTFSDGASASASGLDIFVLLAAACATFLACGICVLSVSAYVYLYLASHDY